jgi:nucleotide-binding universal stress UspA family protein
MYKKILVPLDGSDLAECVLPHVEAIAKGCGTESVIFLRVIDRLYMPGGLRVAVNISEGDIKRADSENSAHAENYLKNLANNIKFNGADVQTQVIIREESENTAEVIAKYATQNEVDLIIIATHGRSGVSRWAWGSVADRILRSACVPVIMVRAPGCIPGM